MNEPLIKHVFGNHDMLHRYLEYLNNPDDIPPFQPVLYKALRQNGDDDIETINQNEHNRYCAINRLVKRELLNNFEIYRQLQNR